MEPESVTIRTAHIGLMFDNGTSYCRGVLRGIKRYAASRSEWVLLPFVPEARTLRTLEKFGIDGLITWVYDSALVERLMGQPRPWVSVCGVTPDRGVPRVGPDDGAIGRLAASHLLDCGLRQFGFIGHAQHAGSARRELGFRHAIEAAGFTVSTFHERGPQQFDARVHGWASNAGFRSWLLALPSPVGVATFYDMWGLQLAEACREAGLRVPEDVAIVGMGNDDLLCELARPSLSSVSVPTEQIGFDAAALLDRIMAGSPPPEGPIVLPPTEVVARQSTDILAILDPEVVAALRLIRRERHRPIRVVDVLREVPVSRRSLERKFRKILNRGVSEEIRRVQLEHAKSLLASTDLPMSVLAQRAGFSNAKHLSVAFRAETGQTPTSYRGQFRMSFEGR